MTKRSLMFALGATLLLSGSTAAVSATPHTLSGIARLIFSPYARA